MELNPVNKLKEFVGNFVDYVFNNIETMYGIEHDNQHEPVTIPASYHATCYGLYNAKLTGNDWHWSWWAGGAWSILYTYDVSYANGGLNYTGFSEVGRYDKSVWDQITDYNTGLPNADEAYRILHSYIANNEQMYIMSTESESLPYEITYLIDDVYQKPKVLFGKNNNSGSVYSKYQCGDGNGSPTGTLLSAQYVNIGFWDFDITSDGDGYVIADTGLNEIPTSYNWCRFKDAAVITKTTNQDYINNYITNNGAEHNYTYNYETETGDAVTVYYGDNYIIYKCDDDAKFTYDDNYNILKKVSDDTGTDLDVPTYIDKKYPPEPPMPPLESDDQTDGGDYGSAEFVRMYACTNSELNKLMLWMSGGAAGTSGTDPVPVPDNFNPMDQIIGLIGYPMEIETGITDDTTFTFRNAANQTINTGWATKTTMALDRLIDFGTVDVPFWEKRENGVPFLDYSATVECYVPFCGIMALDPQSVMGCTLTCRMWVDYATGDCSCIVYSNYGGGQHPVGYSSGNCGASQPMSSAAFGQLQGARATASHKMNQSVLGGVKNLVTSVIGGAKTGYIQGGAASTVGVPVGHSPYLANAIQGAGAKLGAGAGAIGSAIGSAIDLGVTLTHTNLDNRFATEMAKNSLGTSVSGNFGQQTAWHYFNKPYIKVTWPTPVSKRVTKYGHTYGVPVYKDSTVSDYTGYTIFNNVDLSGIYNATPTELSAIKQFLETGVYINGGGE